MNWVSFISGGMAVLFIYALFAEQEEENELELELEEGIRNDLIVNSSTGRFVTLSCQTCRKLKRHKEIEPDLYQCIKCKRHVDLRKI
ncbi:hypothetical protein [Bacillus cereus]|uniref:hypothetical protein n=1 Tax=Bacillus cereus TaxID=1396 RepID=UPI000BEDEB5E|nr:hypothetical protein [Bacillus cereus]PED29441.1 hypothetical protein CON13_25265 [Bacillus cereus]PEE50287.1 hypothetical protein COM80_26025 [Bacillus cereus]PFL96688.1 hypothetical protein COJ35_08640 [Bacillus cereus]PFV66750.1 hypothetical protein COL16_23820 [Bacillus cereus]PGS40015.1 hypothetical protein COC56_01100 [Bacillus cereus]